MCYERLVLLNMYDNFKNLLKKELDNIDKYIKKIQSNSKDENDCFLEIKKSRGKYIQFYKCFPKETLNNGKTIYERSFIKHKDISIAMELAQKEFDKQILNELNNRQKKLKKILEYYEKHPLDGLYKRLSPERKMLIKSDFIDDEAFIKNWYIKYKKAENEQSYFLEKYPITTNYFTEKKEHVRSKSEMIIADKLCREGIHYVYEPRTNLSNNNIRPDFVILNLRTKKTFYFEHFGMMDNPEYASKCVKKITLYRSLGYEYGENFLYSLETSTEGLNIKDIDEIINRYLL